MKHQKEEVLGFLPSGSRTASVSHDAPRRQTSPPSELDRRILRMVLERMGNPPIAVQLWDGERFSEGEGPPPARLIFHDRATLWRVLLSPDYEFGEAYSEGRAEVDGSLPDCLEVLYRALAQTPRGWLRRFPHWPRRPRGNTLSRSRENISHHYDIGNAFYRLWLDEQLLYTCAYYPSPQVSLEQAQVAKMDHVCRKLRLCSGQSVVETGCGWGALSLHMARHYGVKVRAFNISREQIRYARERAKQEGLSDRVEFVEDDYRNVSGTYDAFVSVGMLEHVGPDHYSALGEVIHRSLKPQGLALLHFIGRSHPGELNPWIERRIFPGAHPPTLRELADVLEPYQFSVLDVENLRLHYARTLEEWLARFEHSSPQVREMFDERFVRAWRLYLAGSIAAFRTGTLQLFQVLFAGPLNNAIPWTRDDLYAVRPQGSPKNECSS